MDKKYPKAIILRKNIIILAIAGFVCILLLIFYNFYHSTHKVKLPSDAHITAVAVDPNVAASEENNWYENLSIQKTTKSENEMAKKADINIQNSSNMRQKNNDMIPIEAEDSFYQKAKVAPISSNQITVENLTNTSINTTNVATLSQQDMSKNVVMPNQDQENDQNLQTEKRDFLKNNKENNDNEYLNNTLKNSQSPYEIKAGTIIPSILLTGINSDLPGQIIGQVRANVYDTVVGNHLLIPQGSKIVGLYDSQVAYGQERVLIVWKRILFPNGQSLDLQGMPGVDLSGYAGFKDQVNNHYSKIFGSVLLLSIIGAGAQLSQPSDDSDSDNPSVIQTLAASLGTNLANTANSITMKNLNVQPTLEIRPGYLFNISVTKDMVFPQEYSNSEIKR